ncbi:MAG: N-acetylmuramoyl-L-alanine amidase [Lachnospiraceae bacterium]|nr:N-acetylmuramoyl-L-alanine amidase [Lachnospiraceae bacterium]
MHSPKLFIKRYGIGIGIGLLVSAGVLLVDSKELVSTFQAANNQAKYTVVIDSGHGGVDPGKVSVDGAYEKTINLAIAKELKEVLSRNDCQVIMTRETDEGLYQETDRNKKRADMAERLKIMNGCEADVVVSIHQNSYSDRTSKGAQVFYQATSERGKQLAARIQQTIVEQVDPENHRQIKANNDYYLLKNTTSTMVIVECGFLSNPQESEKLQDAAYQKKLAESIGMGVLYYLGESGETNDGKEELHEDKNTASPSGDVSK